MKFDSLKVTNFRNYEKVSLKFSPYLNIIYGKNGSGKTNIVESLYVLALTKSFRTKDDISLIKQGNVSTKIEGKVKNPKSNNYQVIINSEGKKVKINNIQEYKMSNYISNINIILFQPDDQMLLKLAPSVRRKMLNIEISQLNKDYVNYLNDYNKLLKQRNRLLKDAENDRKTFDATVGVWSEGIAHESALIGKFRYDYVREAGKHIERFFSEMTGGSEKPSVTFAGSAKQEEEAFSDTEATEKEYLSLLTSNTEREIAVGSTLWGAHKDDIRIDLNGRSARDFSSQGQQRSLALAMKLAEGELCRRDIGEYPVFLLDDVLSELDAKRKAYLVNEIKGKQVIMTGCDLSIKAENTVFVKNGCYLTAEE